MWNSNIFQNFNAHYQPLPSAALKAAREGLFDCGFSKTAALEDFEFTLEKEQILKTNILAFTHSVRRIPEYAGVTVFNVVNGYDNAKLVSVLARSSAPFHLLHHGTEFSFWASGFVNNEPVPIPVENHISYDQLKNMLSNYANDLNPGRILDVKRGYAVFNHLAFRAIQPLQLSLWAMDVNRERLVRHFGLAVDELRSYKYEYPKLISDENITDIAIQLLGATVLADTGVLGEDIRRDTEVSLNTLMSGACGKFGLYFQKDLFDSHMLAAEKAHTILRQIRYAEFTPDMLRDLYVEAYSEEERKLSGSYDTPLYLTRRIWENIPVEYLPLEKRVFADMTCGWGSFLIAGHERLSKLSDMKDLSLRSYLWGNDKYPFTAKLAGLGLLLSTSEDSWNIRSNDVLKKDWLGTLRPNIIVGNPPFRGSRRESLTTERKRYQHADAFLDYALKRLAPGGYLAMVMPRTFPIAQSSPDLRQKLLQQCDILEFWELPTNVFSGANSRAMVLFAQKKLEAQSTSHNPVRVRTIQRSSLKEFQGSGAFTASSLVSNQSNWQSRLHGSKGTKNKYRIEYKLILSELIWREIRKICVDLQENVDIFQGAIVGNKGKNITQKAAKREVSAYSNPIEVPWILEAKGVITNSFCINYGKAAKILYPNGLQWPRLEKKQIFEGTKVLVVSAIDPSWGKRNRVAIERKGYYVSENFWIVTPLPDKKEYITPEVIAAVLDWDISNAWIIEHQRSMKILDTVISTIPFPTNLSDKDCKALTRAVLQLEEACTGDREALEAKQTIDLILKDAYNLDETTFARLRNVTEWFSRPEVTLDVQPEHDKIDWFTGGIVDSIDLERETISLFIDGFDTSQTVRIHPSMPGWLLRSGAAFLTKIPGEYLDKGVIDQDTINWGRFYPQPFMYMNEDELLGELSKHFIPG